MLVLAKCRLSSLYKKAEEYKLIEELAGSSLVGKKYTPCLPYHPLSILLIPCTFSSQGLPLHRVLCMKLSPTCCVRVL